jgi:hypothetical protein
MHPRLPDKALVALHSGQWAGCTAHCAGDALSHIRVRTTFKLATELRDRSSSRGRPPTRVYTVQDYNNPCDCHVGSLELATMRLPRAAAAISVLCFLSSTPGTVAALCRYCCLPATHSPLCSLAPPRSTCAALHRFSHTACLVCIGCRPCAGALTRRGGSARFPIPREPSLPHALAGHQQQSAAVLPDNSRPACWVVKCAAPLRHTLLNKLQQLAWVVQDATARALHSSKMVGPARK